MKLFLIAYIIFLSIISLHSSEDWNDATTGNTISSETIKEKQKNTTWYSKIYFGLGVGSSSYNDNGIFEEISTNDIETKNNSSQNFYLGYQASDYLGIEMDYINFGEYKNNLYLQKLSAINFNATASYPLFNNQLRPLLLLGFGVVTIDENSDALSSSSAGSLTGGIALLYEPIFLFGFGVRVGYSFNSYIVEVENKMCFNGNCTSLPATQYTPILSNTYINLQYSF